jgi:hypothetical protein
MLAESYGREVQIVAAEALESMGLSPADGWRLNVETRVAFRQVPE